MRNPDNKAYVFDVKASQHVLAVALSDGTVRLIDLRGGQNTNNTIHITNSTHATSVFIIKCVFLYLTISRFDGATEVMDY